MPDGEPVAAALVLPGSSNRPATGRAELLARHGVAALTMPLYGSDLEEVPLERFSAALDELSSISDRLAVVGVSKGAEAALLLAAHDSRITAVAAFAPSSVVWAGLAGRRRSSWTLRGRPIPFVAYDESWAATTDPPAYRELYERSLLGAPDDAWIPVEGITADVLLVAGGDDQVWPSLPMAHDLARRCRATVVTHPGAGHRTTLPGEPVATGGQPMARGGTDEADAALGSSAWPHLLRLITGS
jgi:dienelactone hydrolase